MKRLTPLPLCPKQTYESSFVSKQEPVKTFLTNNKPAVEGAIDDYLLKRPQLSRLNMPIVNDLDKEKFLSVFTSKTSAFKKILSDLRHNQPTNFQKEYCQYCGINLNKSTDHFFPKEQYPHLAAVFINLIPCCKDCNTLKSTNVYDQNGHRKFINLYYDDFTDVEFLKCNVTFINTQVPNINYSLDLSSLQHFQQTIVFNHFSELKLLNIYGDTVGCYFEEISRESFNIQSALDLKEAMENKLNAMIPIYGINYYKACLLKELIQKYLHFFNYITLIRT